jgi:NADP-dependent 3-hydroxy acid dehydrogenase YdfG
VEYHHPDTDQVILNAGFDLPQRIEAFDWRLAKRQIDTNLTASYVAFAARLLPQLLARGTGRCAVVSSPGAIAGCPREHAYSASNASPRTVADSLRAELLASPVAVRGGRESFSPKRWESWPRSS